MLGWEIFIHRLDPSQTLKTREFTQASVVTKWRAGLGGYDWIKVILKKDKATALGGNGYPFLFSAKFNILQPIILNGAPVHKGPMMDFPQYRRHFSMSDLLLFKLNGA